jgi:transcriptional regulator with XRE-family HTH domain
MRVNAELILRLRKDKAWSQDELAIASGLNLRTVQRIETEATASLQSVKALASAFGMSIRDLQLEDSAMIGELVGKDVTIVMGISTGLAASSMAFNDSVKGKIVKVEGTWLKLMEKKRTLYINTTLIKRIVPE